MPASPVQPHGLADDSPQLIGARQTPSAPPTLSRPEVDRKVIVKAEQEGAQRLIVGCNTVVAHARTTAKAAMVPLVADCT